MEYYTPKFVSPDWQIIIMKNQSPQWSFIEDELLTVCRVVIEDEEFQYCVNVGNNYASTKWKENKYRDGLMNEDNDSILTAEVTGAFGEMAVAKILKLKFNCTIFDDKFALPSQDFIINDTVFDAKCASKFYRNYGKNYIKATHEDGTPCELHPDFYFLSYINTAHTNLESKKATVDIVGVIAHKNVCKVRMKKSPKKDCNHYNYEIEFNNTDIKSIKEVYDRFFSSNVVQTIDSENFVMDF